VMEDGVLRTVPTKDGEEAPATPAAAATPAANAE
jgi:hypothetical protein